MIINYAVNSISKHYIASLEFMSEAYGVPKCVWEWKKENVCVFLTCPSSMSPLKMPSGLSSVLLVRRIDRLWALRFCFGWRPAKAEPLLLPPSPGIPPTSREALPPAWTSPEDQGNKKKTDLAGSRSGCSAISTWKQINSKSIFWQTF